MTTRSEQSQPADEGRLDQRVKPLVPKQGSPMRRGLTLIELAIVAAIICILALTLYMPAQSCAKQAKKMGMNHDWELVQGCMVEVKPGQWVPLHNYRVL